MKLYHFPSPNPQKVTFALLELGLDCEKIPVDLAKGEQREPAFLAVNPAGRVPVLADGDLTVAESHAILAYLGETTGRLWPATAAGRAQALQWLFFLSQHLMPAAGEVALRIRARVVGIPVDEATVARGEKALPTPLGVVEGRLAKNQWMLGPTLASWTAPIAQSSPWSRRPASASANFLGSAPTSTRCVPARPGGTRPSSRCCRRAWPAAGRRVTLQASRPCGTPLHTRRE
jgi:glutathione S-transferase